MLRLKISIFILLAFTIIFLPVKVFAAENIYESGFYLQKDNISGILSTFWQDVKSVFSTKEPDVKGFSSAKGIHRTKLTNTVFGFFPYWTSENAYLDYEALSHISYFSLVAKTNGSLDKRYWPKESLISNAKAHDVKFLITITNFNSSEIDLILNNESNRNNLVKSITEEVNKYKLDGATIDFETPNPSAAANFNIFLESLKKELSFTNEKAEVYVATWPVDWAPDNYDYKKMAQIADGFFIMAYNYHYAGSPKAGPVTTFDGTSRWGQYTLKWTIDDYLKQKTNNESDKLIMGLPYYGLDWQVDSANVPANTLGTAKAFNYAGAKDMAIKYGRKWDPDSKNPYVIYSDSGQTRQLWYDDAESLSYKYQLALDNRLGGVGIWALGFDAGTNDLWNVLKAYFSIPVADIDNNRMVDAKDLDQIITNYSKDEKISDINQDGIVNAIDASFILTQWGEYPLPARK